MVKYTAMSKLFERYSAKDIFGAPLEIGFDPKNPRILVDLMEAYSIEPQDVPSDSTDITPYYWRRPAFKYFLSLPHPEGPAVVELLPNNDDSETYAIENVPDFGLCVEQGIRRIEIPTEQPGMAIIGPSPRFSGKICVHELVVYNDN